MEGEKGVNRGERLEKTLSVFTILPFLVGSSHRPWPAKGGLTLSWEHSELVAAVEPGVLKPNVGHQMKPQNSPTPVENYG